MATSKVSRVQSDLVELIADHIRRENIQPNERLVETALATEFGVSRSPVRAALRILADRGVVTSNANKGHRLSTNARTLLERAPNTDRPAELPLYNRISIDRMRNEVPESFTEAGLMRRYGVSRAELSRTLAQMTHDGLVRRGTGHHWTFLAALNTRKAYLASYRFRLMIEPLGLLEPTFTLNVAAIERCRRSHDELLGLVGKGKLTGRDIFQTNAEFHEALAVMSGNVFIGQAIQQQNALRRLSEFFVYESELRIETLVSEHLEIIDALTNNDNGWASSLMRRHLEMAGRQRPDFWDAED